MPRGIKYMKNMCSSHTNLGFFISCSILCCLSIETEGEKKKKKRKKKEREKAGSSCKLYVFDESDRPDWLFFGGTQRAAFLGVPFYYLCLLATFSAGCYSRDFIFHNRSAQAISSNVHRISDSSVPDSLKGWMVLPWPPFY